MIKNYKKISLYLQYLLFTAIFKFILKIFKLLMVRLIVYISHEI